MKTIESYVRALGRWHTYDLRRNYYLWFGFLWGLPIPIFSILLDLTLTGAGPRTPLDAIREHPVHLLFLAHPFLFAGVFGAMGTIRRDLERENVRLIAELTGLAVTDPLTGLYNRRYVMEELANALHRSHRSGEPVSVVLFDLDEFKSVNEERGHLAGDDVLRQAADALRSVVRKGDTLGRYGGDEFLLVVLGDLPSAREIAARARVEVERRAVISVSAGVARWPDDGSTREELLASADRLLAEAKAEHRACRGVSP